jgi:hypothetical protein
VAFFVILNHPNGGVVPLVDEEGEQVATFDTADDAAEAVQENALGRAYGGKVFDTDEPLRDA